MNKLDELYKAKGQLTTEMEVAQARIGNINKQIVEELNKLAKRNQPTVGKAASNGAEQITAEIEPDPVKEGK